MKPTDKALVDEDSDSEGDQDYVPSDPACIRENDCYSDDDNDNGVDTDNDSDDDDGLNAKNVTATNDDKYVSNSGASQATNMIMTADDPCENENERRNRLSVLFDDFIGSEDKTNPASFTTKQSTNNTFGDNIGCELVNVEERYVSNDGDIFSNVYVPTSSVSSKRVDGGERDSSVACNRRNRAEKRCATTGLGDAISQLSKKKQISVFKKSTDDWVAFKNETGIGEELQSLNRGKRGYVDRVEFLSRSDLRQFELERNARSAARKK